MLRLFESTFESKEKRENSLSCSILCSRRQMPHSAAADLPVGKPLGWGVSLRASKDENIKVSFEKLISFLTKGFNLIRVYYYTGIPTIDIWDKNKETEKEFK